MANDTDVDVDVDVAAEIIAQHGPFTFMATAAVPNGEATFDEWEAAIKFAQNVEKASPFWVGDLALYGALTYGDMADMTGLEIGTLANRKSVAKAIEPSRRRENVPFAHHQEIAALDSPAEQDMWLDKCETNGLTREELRRELKAAKAETDGPRVELWVSVLCSNTSEQLRLAEQLRKEGFFVKLR